MLEYLSPHLEGELPSYLSELQTASETAPEIVVSENQQQFVPQQQIASKVCTTIIIHPDIKLDSPLESYLETTSSEQVESENLTVSDTSSSVSED